jgi:hypothetical protein
MIKYIEHFFYFMVTVSALAMGFAIITMFFYVGPAIALTGIASVFGAAAALLLVIIPSLKKQWLDRPEWPGDSLPSEQASGRDYSQRAQGSEKSTDEQQVVTPQVITATVTRAKKASKPTIVPKFGAPTARPPAVSG